MPGLQERVRALASVGGEEETGRYERKDGIIACAYFVFLQVHLYFWNLSDIGMGAENAMGKSAYLWLKRIPANNDSLSNWATLLGDIPSNVIPIIVILAILLIRRQKLGTLGFRRRHNLTACMIGILVGVLFALIMYGVVLAFQIPTILNRLGSIRFSVFTVVSRVVFTGLPEELSFRAYLQSRVSVLIRNQWIAGLTVGLLFWASHLILDWKYGMPSPGTLLFQAIFMIVTHLIFYTVYRRTDNILASTFAHGIYDLMIEAAYS